MSNPKRVFSFLSMKEYYIDFSIIGDHEDFYEQITQKLENNIQNTDDLSSFIESFQGDFHLEFVNLSVDQLETFEELLEILEDMDENNKHFSFSYFLEQFED